MCVVNGAIVITPKRKEKIQIRRLKKNLIDLNS